MPMVTGPAPVGLFLQQVDSATDAWILHQVLPIRRAKVPALGTLGVWTGPIFWHLQTVAPGSPLAAIWCSMKCAPNPSSQSRSAPNRAPQSPLCSLLQNTQALIDIRLQLTRSTRSRRPHGQLHCGIA